MSKASSDRPSYPGVAVQIVETAKKTTYVGRYTLPNGRRPTIRRDTWTEAFTAAVEAQKVIERGSYRNPESAQMTFGELVTDHWAATTDYKAKSLASRTSHLGNATGQPNGAGRKNERAARFALLAWFGDKRLSQIGPQEVRLWQQGMVEAGYAQGSILAKRSLLASILELAMVNGWIDLNPVLAVKAPKSRAPRNPNHGRGLMPEDFNRMRATVTSETFGLLVDTKLEAGLRYQAVSGLRAMDVMAPTAKGVQHLWVRQGVNWPGKEFANNRDERGRQLSYLIEGIKSDDWYQVAISPELYERLVDYIEKYQLTREALIFDVGRVKAETATSIKRSQAPAFRATGRYVNPKTGRSGEHGKYYTYNYGCHCPPCRNANSEYRFWLARMKGRASAQPWLEPGFIESRSDAVDPLPYWTWHDLWTEMVVDAGLDWQPVPHSLRHAMVSWSLEGGATLRQVQRDAHHANVATTQVYVDKLDLGLDTKRVDAFKKFMMGDPAPVPSSMPMSPFEQVFSAWLNSLSPEEKVALMTEAMTKKSAIASPALRVISD